MKYTKDRLKIYQARKTLTVLELPMTTATTRFATLVFVVVISTTHGFYLPGVAPQSWNDGDTIGISVDSLSSPKTRLPYDYYDFPFCKPKQGVVASGETLGEIFAGMRVESTGYDVQMAVNSNCKVLCQVDMKKEDVEKVKKLIDDQYVVNLMVDNLPGAMELQSDAQGSAVQFGLGYWVGGIILDLPEGVEPGIDGSSIVQIAKASETAPRYLNNHIKLKLFYHVPATLKEYTGYTGASDDPVSGANAAQAQALKQNPDGTNAKRIVRFEVHPYSIKHVYDIKADKFDPKTVQTCTENSKVYGDVGNGQNLLLDTNSETGMKVVYSYGVEWINSPTSWATRWYVTSFLFFCLLFFVSFFSFKHV